MSELGKIKNGSKSTIDMALFVWPPSDYEDNIGLFSGLSDSQVFSIKKINCGIFNFECIAPGFGHKDNYGSGSIFTEDVEML